MDKKKHMEQFILPRLPQSYSNPTSTFVHKLMQQNAKLFDQSSLPLSKQALNNSNVSTNAPRNKCTNDMQTTNVSMKIPLRNSTMEHSDCKQQPRDLFDKSNSLSSRDNEKETSIIRLQLQQGLYAQIDYFSNRNRLLQSQMFIDKSNTSELCNRASKSAQTLQVQRNDDIMTSTFTPKEADKEKSPDGGLSYSPFFTERAQRKITNGNLNDIGSFYNKKNVIVNNTRNSMNSNHNQQEVPSTNILASNAKAFKCIVEDCPAIFDNMRSRDYHQQIHNAVYVCPDISCHKHYLSVLELNHHYAVHKQPETCSETTLIEQCYNLNHEFDNLGSSFIDDEEYDSGHSVANSNRSSPSPVSEVSQHDSSFLSCSDEAIDLSVSPNEKIISGMTKQSFVSNKDERQRDTENNPREENTPNGIIFECEDLSYKDNVVDNNQVCTDTTNENAAPGKKQMHELFDETKSYEMKSKKRKNLSSTGDRYYSKRHRVGKSSHPVPWLRNDTDKSIVIFEYKNGYQEEHEVVHGRLRSIPQEEERVFVCSHCQIRTSKKTEALRHVAIFPNHSISLLCVTCGENFPCVTTLHAHILQRHRIELEQVSQCPQDFCERKFSSGIAAANHILTTGHGERRYRCPFNGCGKKFRTQGQLNHHQPIHTDMFQCAETVCGKRFRDAYNLRMHSMIHTGERPKICPHCPFSCIQKNSLDWHVKKHHSSASSD